MTAIREVITASYSTMSSPFLSKLLMMPPLDGCEQGEKQLEVLEKIKRFNIKKLEKTFCVTLIDFLPLIKQVK